MNIIWKNQADEISLCNFPGFKLFAKEIEEVFFTNFKNPLVKEVFELSKELPGEKIQGIVGIEAILPIPMPGIPNLLSYDFEFLLCLEYLFVTDKTWQECKNVSAIFQLINSDHPNSQMGYNFLRDFLVMCVKEKRDLQTVLI